MGLKRGRSQWEIRLRVFDNRVLRRIFGSKRVELIGQWRQLQNEELNEMFCTPNIIWMVK